mmetsp:Transcript_926/g.2155  ORF Transcript_926/g.2155 Transcript_926/m.2155 type:complete len:209 (-) Transcript_926:157-783(-)
MPFSKTKGKPKYTCSGNINANGKRRSIANHADGVTNEEEESDVGVDDDDDDVSTFQSSSDAAGGELTKCSVCKKRFCRKNCLIGACVQCCNDPTCAPHSEAREQLKRKKAILDGTNVITELAKKKRASKVTPGLFHDTSIEYFGETAVLWNVGEFLENTKLREDAMRRCRRKTATVQSKRESENKVGGGRAKRFKYIHEQLYQKSLQK